MFALILISLCGLPVRARAAGVDPDVREKVLAARAEAIKVIREYARNSNYDENTREVASRMAHLLKESGVALAVGKGLAQCNADPKMAAGTDLKGQNVWLCAYALSLKDASLMQVFIHESYHLYEGIDYYRLYNPELYERFISNGFEMTPAETDDSEKRAATIEFEITMRIFRCIFFKTEYFKRLLGLQQDRNYTFCK